MRVLIAEDTPLLQEMISDFMDCWGYEFDLASNGLEAVNLAKAREGQKAPDLNLCPALTHIHFT
jgi:DNA-binding response OmpR family regulator